MLCKQNTHDEKSKADDARNCGMRWPFPGCITNTCGVLVKVNEPGPGHSPRIQTCSTESLLPGNNNTQQVNRGSLHIAWIYAAEHLYWEVRISTVPDGTLNASWSRIFDLGRQMNPTNPDLTIQDGCTCTDSTASWRNVTVSLEFCLICVSFNPPYTQLVICGHDTTVFVCTEFRVMCCYELVWLTMANLTRTGIPNLAREN